MSGCVYETRDRQRWREKEREGNISSRQLFSIVLLHAQFIFLVSGDSRGFHPDFSHISEFGKAVSPVRAPPSFSPSHLLAVIHIAFEAADMVQSQNTAESCLNERFIKY